MKSNPRLSKEQLDDLMHRMKLSQNGLAEELGVQQSSISRWLAGKARIPKLVDVWLKAAYPEIYWEFGLEGEEDASGN